MTSRPRTAGLALAVGLVPLVLAASARATDAAQGGVEGAAARCQAARARVAERIGADAAACERDWDCVPFAPQLFGCELYVDRHAWTAPALLSSVAAACTGVALAQGDCAARVGACEAGRCTSRPPSGVGCDGALEAARARAGAPTLCDHDSECALAAIDATWFAVARGFWEGAVREEHALRDRCTARDPFEEPDPRPHARCMDGLCRASAEASPARAPRIERACVQTVIARQAAIRSLARKQGRVLARLVVDDRGIPRQFSFDDDTPPDLASAIVSALRGCPVEPALDDHGRPVPLSVALPLTFR